MVSWYHITTCTIKSLLKWLHFLTIFLTIDIFLPYHSKRLFHFYSLNRHFLLKGQAHPQSNCSTQKRSMTLLRRFRTTTNRRNLNLTTLRTTFHHCRHLRCHLREELVRKYFFSPIVLQIWGQSPWAKFEKIEGREFRRVGRWPGQTWRLPWRRARTEKQN